MDADQAEGPCARRSKFRQGRQGRREVSARVGRSAAFTRVRKQPERRPGRSESVQKLPIGQRGDGHQGRHPPHADNGRPIVERLFATETSHHEHAFVSSKSEQMFVFVVWAV